MRPVGADAEPSTARSNGRAASLVSTVHPRTVASLREHPDAAAIPLLPSQEYAELRADIRNRGVLDPLLVLRDGTVIDGRHRLRVAREFGLLVVPCLEFVPAPDEDPYERMLRAAVLRRHLTPGQRAALALELVVCQEGRVRERSGGVLVAGRTREVAAGLGCVSARTVQAAATVKHETPELYEQVRSGARSANDAARELRRRTSPKRRNPCRNSVTSSELTRAIAAVERVVRRLQEAREQVDRRRRPEPDEPQLARCARESAARLRAVAKVLERLVGRSKSERPDRQRIGRRTGR